MTATPTILCFSRTASFTVLLTLISATASADCHFFAAAGSQITPRNGNCIGASAEPKNGIERCNDKDKTDRQLSELTFTNGKRTGQGWYTDYNDQRLEFEFDNGAASGPGRLFDKNGKLMCEAQFSGGTATGPVREYYPNGKLRSTTLYRNGKNEPGKIEFTESGSLSSLTCAPNSMGPEDRSPCGFDGQPSTVELDRGPNRKGMYLLTHENGKLLRKKITDNQGREMHMIYSVPGNEDEYSAKVLSKSGGVFREFAVNRGQYDGTFKEYFENGQLLEETIFDRGQPKKQSIYFMNGKLKHAAELMASTASAVRVIRYYDNGKPNIETQYTDARYADAKDGGWSGYNMEGIAKTFRDDGTLQWQEIYQKGQLEGATTLFRRDGSKALVADYRAGHMIKLTCLDNQGKKRFVEERFEDGSSKSASPDMSMEQAKKQNLCESE